MKAPSLGSCLVCLVSILILSACATPLANSPIASTTQVARSAASPTTALPNTSVPTATIAPAMATNTALPTSAALPTNTATNTPAVTPTLTNTIGLPAQPFVPTEASVPVTRALSATVARPTITSTRTTASAVTRIQTALKKNSELKAYHGEILFSINHAQILDWRGDINGPNAHFTFISDWYSNDTEVTAIGAQLYRREYDSSSNSYAGAWTPDPKPESKAYYVQSPRHVIQDMVGNPADYTRVGISTVDGLQCDGYMHTMTPEAVKAFLTATTNLGAAFAFGDGMGEIDSAQVVVAVCPDGYIHSVGMHLTPKPSTDSKNPALGEIFLVASLSNPNAPVQITAP